MKLEDLSPSVAESLTAHAPHLLALLDVTSIPEPNGYQVLVIQYVRPDKVGNVYVAAVTQKEDKYQGRAGMVLALGPDAYKGDLQKYPSGAWVQPGDWVVWPSLESAVARFEYGRGEVGTCAVLALLADDRMLAKGIDPTLVLR